MATYAHYQELVANAWRLIDVSSYLDGQYLYEVTLTDGQLTASALTRLGDVKNGGLVGLLAALQYKFEKVEQSHKVEGFVITANAEGDWLRGYIVMPNTLIVAGVLTIDSLEK